MAIDVVVRCRVLVVEDETLIAVLIEDIVGAMQCEIIGPTGKLETALELARDGVFDIATLSGGRATLSARHSLCSREWILGLGAARFAAPPTPAHEAVYACRTGRAGTPAL